MREAMADKRGDMGYEEIMSLFRQEYKSPQLTKVESSLYDKMNHYIRSLRKESERELAVNPSSQASMMINDQLKKATEKVKRGYELRQRKIALLSLRRVAGDNPGTSNLTPDELVLYSSLTSVLGAHQDGNADFENTGPRFSEPKDIVNLPDAPPRKGSAKEDEASETEDAREDLVLVRVLEDVPTFAGVDRDYTLKKEDLVSLPKNVADTLASHGKIKLMSVSL